MILRTFTYLLYIKISQSSLVVLMALLNGSCIPHEKWVVISVTLSICCTYFTEGGSGTDPEKKTMQISMINTFKVVIHTLQLEQHIPLYTAGQIFNTATYFSDFLLMSSWVNSNLDYAFTFFEDICSSFSCSEQASKFSFSYNGGVKAM